MTSPDRRGELAAVLTRAATVEAARQAAVQRGDTAARDALERELRELWRQHGELERAIG
jgi:hypothetical protein